MSNKKTKSLRQFYPLALTVAGSDSGGGAGIEADLRTFNAFGVFSSCVITAVTSQNPRQVTRIDKMSAESVKAQIDAVAACFAPAFVKSGMLADPEIAEVLADAVKRYKMNLICDPVLVATSGAELGEKTLVDTLCKKLLPCAAWMTPNSVEAEKLLGGSRKISTEQELFSAAKELYERYGASVLLKGGHLNLPEAVDAVCRGGKLYKITSPRVDIPPYAGHGTGCTLSSALTAGLVLDYPWKQALCEAKSFVLGSLTQNVELAEGVFAMYPPTEDCYDLIKLESVEG
jgi:hydroxymethylpyrimidine/phosphomethylpyrimidine kinase